MTAARAVVVLSAVSGVQRRRREDRARRRFPAARLFPRRRPPNRRSTQPWRKHSAGPGWGNSLSVSRPVPGRSLTYGPLLANPPADKRAPGRMLAHFWWPKSEPSCTKFLMCATVRQFGPKRGRAFGGLTLQRPRSGRTSAEPAMGRGYRSPYGQPPRIDTQHLTDSFLSKIDIQ